MPLFFSSCSRRKRFSTTDLFVWGGIALFFLLWNFQSNYGFAMPEEITLQGPIPIGVQEIEIAYPEGHPPSVSLKSAKPSTLSAFRPSGRSVDLLTSPKEIVSFGGSQHEVNQEGHKLTIRSQTEVQGPHGQKLFFHRRDSSLDVLSYGALHIRGEASGPLTFAIADAAARQREDNVPLLGVVGPFDVRVPLTLLARRVDLRYLASLVLLPQERANTVILETLALEQSEHRHEQKPGLGFWLWEYQDLPDRGDALLEECQRLACTRLFVQIPADKDPPTLWAAYAQFLRSARSRGIEAFALDGYPEAIDDPTPLVKKIRHLLTLMDGESLAGVQLDIEPYLLEDFFVREAGFVRYLAVIDRVKETLGPHIRLSVAMPFWFTSQTVNDRPVAFSVMDRVDEVAVMSYRTDVEEVRTCAEDTLRYGDIVNVPVWLALETRALPLEQHVVLDRVFRRELADAYLDRAARRVVFASPPATEGIEGFRVHSWFTVRPEQLTFANRSRQSVRTAISSVINTTPNRSFAGMVIHDLNGFLALREGEQ